MSNALDLAPDHNPDGHGFDAAYFDALVDAYVSLPDFSRKVYDACENALYAEPGFTDVTVEDIADTLNVKPVAVNAALGHMMESGLIQTDHTDVNRTPRIFINCTAYAVYETRLAEASTELLDMADAEKDPEPEPEPEINTDRLGTTQLFWIARMDYERCVGPSQHASRRCLRSLVDRGIARTFLYHGDERFTLTDAGKAWCAEQKAPEPQPEPALVLTTDQVIAAAQATTKRLRANSRRERAALTAPVKARLEKIMSRNNSAGVQEFGTTTYWADMAQGEHSAEYTHVGTDGAETTLTAFSEILSRDNWYLVVRSALHALVREDKVEVRTGRGFNHRPAREYGWKAEQD